MKLLIFDFDGTLGDTQRNIVLTMQQTMEALGLPVASEAEICATIGLPLEESFCVLFPGQTEEETALCARTYREIFERNRKILVPRLFPHAKEMLSALQEQGCTMTVASSRSSASLKGFLDDMGIAPFFSLVLGADNVSRAKPDPAPVLATLEALGARPEETWVVGDMPVDILMGRRAGAKTCAVTFGNATREALLEAGADYLVDDLSEIPGLMLA